MIDVSLFLREPQRLPEAIGKHARATLGYAIDRTVAHRVDPRDGLLISGFWRSGTTWVQQQVAARCSAKTIFEPFCPQAGWQWRPSIGNRESLAAHAAPRAVIMPYCSPDAAPDPALRKRMRAALTGAISGTWVRRARVSPRDAFRRRVVVKLVLGQLCFRVLAETFSVPAIHVWRDPRAVAASIMRSKWWTGWLDNIQLDSLLLEPADGRRAFFERYQSEIAELDRGTPLDRLVGLWCLTELFVGSGQETTNAQVRSLAYEDVVADSTTLDRALGLADSSIPDSMVAQASPTTEPTRLRLTAEERLRGWRAELDVRQVSRIEDIVRSLGLKDRLL